MLDFTSNLIRFKLSDSCGIPPLVKPKTALLQRRALGTPDRGGIPVAAWKEKVAILLHGVYQYEIASAVQLDRKYGVVMQRVAYGAQCTVDEAALFVEVASEADLDTRSRQHSQRRLRRGIAEIPR